MSKLRWVCIGKTGVDSGALLITDPCYIRGEFGIPDVEAAMPGGSVRQVVNKLGLEVGVSASTAHGDGCYDVYGLYLDDEHSRPQAMCVVTSGCGHQAIQSLERVDKLKAKTESFLKKLMKDLEPAEDNLPMLVDIESFMGDNL